ncbi:MAG: hypothetical protein WBP93_03185, partial [Pyrinomonadaceae bacterium]
IPLSLLLMLKIRLHNKHKPKSWRFGVLAALAVTLLALYPQVNLWIERGRDWNGSYASFDFDEIAYSSYLQQLIEGRPRRNDPYTGRDSDTDSLQAESLFSIQFLPAYTLSTPARMFGLSSSIVFIALNALSAFLSTLAVFWLLRAVGGRPAASTVGALATIVLGTHAASFKAVWLLLQLQPTFSFFPFLRRYLPALPFPFFFIFCALVWLMLQSEDRRTAFRHALMAGLILAALVFSYFFLWTAAVAWLFCLAALLLMLRPDRWQVHLKMLCIVFAVALIALVPYATLLSHRAQEMDAVQLLTRTHAPDLIHLPELLGFLVLLSLIFASRRGMIGWKDARTLFIASFALLPIAVFNQQVLTGRTLQPFHYERYIANYVALVAVALTLTTMLRASVEQKTRRLALACVAIVVFGTGLFETISVTRRNAQLQIANDESLIVNRRFAEIARETNDTRRNSNTLIFFTDLSQADSLASVSTQPVLWSQHMFVFSGASREENRERFFEYLYYSGLSEREFERLASINSSISLALYGFERVWLRESGKQDQIKTDEVKDDTRAYARYVSTFNRERAMNRVLSYVVTPTEYGPDIRNLDRWYERGGGERVGKFTIYRVKIRN